MTREDDRKISGVRLVVSGIFAVGLIAINLVLAPQLRAETSLPDACLHSPSDPSVCWCEAWPNIHECQFDSQCKTLYPTVCKSTP